PVLAETQIELDLSDCKIAFTHRQPPSLFSTERPATHQDPARLRLMVAFAPYHRDRACGYYRILGTNRSRRPTNTRSCGSAKARMRVREAGAREQTGRLRCHGIRSGRRR